MNLKLIITALTLSAFLTSCDNSAKEGQEQEAPDAHAEGGAAEGEGHEEEEGTHEEGMVSLTAMQRQAIGLKLGPLQNRNLSTAIKATGELELPPQNEANVSAIVGGNVYKINVIEGDKVRKGQTLALLEHPDFVQMQVDLQESASQLNYLENEYKRQQSLYEQKVGSGKAFQEAQADYTSTKASVEGLKAKLNILNLSAEKILEGEIYRFIPVTSPIDGFIKDVNIKMGQYVGPQEMLFGVVDNSHIHADLMVFEKDVYKVKIGQKVSFTVANGPRGSYTGKIYAVGKTFEEDPKAVHVHAEIEGNTENLIPGMYIEGRIAVNDMSTLALPEAAIVGEGEDSFIFVKTEEAGHEGEQEEEPGHVEGEEAPIEHNPSKESWVFRQVPVTTGTQDNGWVEVRLFEPLPDSVQVAYNGAYNLLSEMGKGETGHVH